MDKKDSVKQEEPSAIPSERSKATSELKAAPQGEEEGDARIAYVDYKYDEEDAMGDAQISARESELERQLETTIRTLNTARAEMTTLVSRVTPQYAKNLQAAADMCRTAVEHAREALDAKCGIRGYADISSECHNLTAKRDALKSENERLTAIADALAALASTEGPTPAK